MTQSSSQRHEIDLPWRPESEKPTLSAVICYNGGELYWIGRYDNENGAWMECGDWAEWKVIEGMCWIEEDALIPFAWCDPREFVPFEKKKKDPLIEKRYTVLSHGEIVEDPNGDYTLFSIIEKEVVWAPLKEKELHRCEKDRYFCEEKEGKLIFDGWNVGVYQVEVLCCPFCSFKAGEE